MTINTARQGLEEQVDLMLLDGAELIIINSVLFNFADDAAPMSMYHEYNTMLAAVASSKDSGLPHSRVVYNDMTSGWTQDMTKDNIHANVAGMKYLADGILANIPSAD